MEKALFFWALNCCLVGGAQVTSSEHHFFFFTHKAEIIRTTNIFLDKYCMGIEKIKAYKNAIKLKSTTEIWVATTYQRRQSHFLCSAEFLMLAFLNNIEQSGPYDILVLLTITILSFDHLRMLDHPSLACPHKQMPIRISTLHKLIRLSKPKCTSRCMWVA